MYEDRKIRVAITHGDTNGIGYEIIFKTFARQGMLDLCTPIVYGSPKVATYHRNALGVPANFTIINETEEIKDGRINFVPVFDEEIKVELGKPTEISGNAGLRAIDRALEDFNKGVFDVLVTAPIDNNEEFHFSGQSRYIEDHLELEGQGINMLLNEHLRIALATRNLPLKQVAETITAEKITDSATRLYNSICRDFRISNPRVAILALNPKAGANGLLGSEERDIIAPAIETLEKNNIQCFGPYAADEFFGASDWEHFDATLAMYYDQGLAPFRTLTVEAGVNYLAGLPLVCTAPDMSTGFDIAGKGIADDMSFRHAIYSAIDIYRNRMEYNEPMAAPLPKLFKEKRDETDKVRFTVPKHRNEPIRESE
nr:4-hydroxythreonine-4-phosphate dehydrogenase PdxA [uncultured Prevotella sp.]